MRPGSAHLFTLTHSQPDTYSEHPKKDSQRVRALPAQGTSSPMAYSDLPDGVPGDENTPSEIEAEAEIPQRDSTDYGAVLGFSLSPDNFQQGGDFTPFWMQSLENAVKAGIAREEQATISYMLPVGVPVALYAMFAKLGLDAGCETTEHRQRAGLRYGLEVLDNLPETKTIRAKRVELMDLGMLGAFVQSQYGYTLLHPFLSLSKPERVQVSGRCQTLLNSLKESISLLPADTMALAYVFATAGSEDAPQEVVEACRWEVERFKRQLGEYINAIDLATSPVVMGGWQKEPWKSRGDVREWLPHREASRTLQIPARTLSRWVKSGHVKTKPLGKVTLVNRASALAAKLKFRGELEGAGADMDSDVDGD